MKVWSWVIARASDLGGVLLVVIAALVCVDVVTRKLGFFPVPGVYCYVEVALIAVMLFSLALVEQRGRQISIDFLGRRLQGKRMHLWRAVTALLALAFFGLVTWQESLDWLHALRTHEFAYEVRIPTIIPRGEVVLGAGLVSAELLRKFLVSVWSLFRPRP